MAKYLNKFYDFIDKIGKPNFILIVFILIALITTGLYQTFSLYSEFEGAHLNDKGVYEYKFILNDSNETNTIIIAPGQNKLIDITITNEGEAPLKYGLYYTSNKSSSFDTLIGYRRDTKTLPTGVIKGNTSSIITLKVNNYSSTNLAITFGVKYGFENGEELTLSGEEKWFNVFPLMLSEVESGSYVDYTGNNGCVGESCNGQNANYVDDTNMGYCYNSDNKFSVNGWRVAYSKDGGIVLISAGAPECQKTIIEIKSDSASEITKNDRLYGTGYVFNEETGRFSLTGVTSSELSWTNNYESIISTTPYTCQATNTSCTQLYKVTNESSSEKAYAYTYYGFDIKASTHFANLNATALKYCNKAYAKDGICNRNTAWAIDAMDFRKITGSDLIEGICYEEFESVACGYSNDLIDNGSEYWFSKTFSNPEYYSIFQWDPNYNQTTDSLTNIELGVRPVLHLDDSIIIVGGQGTYDDPYQIENADKKLLSDIAKQGDYVEYTGNNGCSGYYCEGINANTLAGISTGHCYSNSYQFSASGWRVGYISGDNTHIVTAGAPECVNFVNEYTEQITDEIVPILQEQILWGGGYTFNSTTGIYTITNTILVNEFDDYYSHDFSNYSYTCLSDTTTCTTMYKVNTFDGKTLLYTGETYTSSLVGSSTANPIEQFNNVSLKYCNSELVEGGVCDNSTTWSINANDFKKIAGKPLNDNSCYNDEENDIKCGYGNDLIDNNGFYWFATMYDENYGFNWDPTSSWVTDSNTNNSFGVRPVVKLDDAVIVLSGSGTYEDPYIIENQNHHQDY